MAGLHFEIFLFWNKSTQFLMSCCNVIIQRGGIFEIFNTFSAIVFFFSSNKWCYFVPVMTSTIVNDHMVVLRRESGTQGAFVTVSIWQLLIFGVADFWAL